MPVDQLPHSQLLARQRSQRKCPVDFVGFVSIGFDLWQGAAPLLINLL